MGDSDDEEEYGKQDDDNRNVYEKENDNDDNDDTYEKNTRSNPRASMVKYKSAVDFTDDEKLTDPNWEVIIITIIINIHDNYYHTT
jgi:hypothetical protein